MARGAKIQATLLTTAAVLSFAFGENEIIQSKMYNKAKPVFESKYSWESEDRYFLSDYREILDKYEIIHRFASKIIEDSQELEPSIVEFVSKNFWKLI